MAQRDGRRVSLMCSGWNLLFVQMADLEKRCVEHQKRLRHLLSAPSRLIILGKHSCFFVSLFVNYYRLLRDSTNTCKKMQKRGQVY